MTFDQRTIDRINEDEIRRRQQGDLGVRIIAGLFIMGCMYGTGHLLAGPVCGTVFVLVGCVAAAFIIMPFTREAAG